MSRPRPKATETDPTRLTRYAEAFFAGHQQTEWPTVRQAAKSLKWRQARVVDAAKGDPESQLMLTVYNTEPPQRRGEHFVEVC